MKDEEDLTKLHPKEIIVSEEDWELIENLEKRYPQPTKYLVDAMGSYKKSTFFSKIRVFIKKVVSLLY